MTKMVFATVLLVVWAVSLLHAQVVSNGGPPSPQIFMVPGTPSLSVGVYGDVYVDTLTENMYQRTNAGWGLPLMNLKGDTGAQGPTGASPVFASTSVNTDTAGLYVWTFPAPCTGASRFWAIAQGPVPFGNSLVNVQNEGSVIAGTQSFRVTKSNFSTVALLGLTILSIPTAVGATPINIFCAGP